MSREDVRGGGIGGLRYCLPVYGDLLWQDLVALLVCDGGGPSGGGKGKICFFFRKELRDASLLEVS